MADDLVIVPSDGDGYVNLARTKTGRLFRKHLLNYGTLKHPKTGAEITIDDGFYNTLKTNFDNGVCDIVQVPLANSKNEHDEAPDRNIGEVVDIESRDGKIYAVMDIRDPAHAEKLGKTYLGASAMMHLDYPDTKSGKNVGPTLLHSCVTNRPYVTGLDNYEEILAATADRSEDAAVLLSDASVTPDEPVTEESDMPEDKTQETPAEPTLDQLLATLKEKHNIDVSALQAKANEDKSAELSKTILDALTDAGVVKLSNSDDKDAVKTDTVVAAVQKLAGDNVALSHRVQGLEKADAEHAVDQLVTEGRVLPAQRDAFVEMRLTNAAMFDKIVPAQPIVKLSHEVGKNDPKDADHKADLDAEITRLVELANTTRK